MLFRSLEVLIDEIDEDGSGAIEFGEFAQLCAKFLVEDPDPETMRAELKTAFRLFDKQGTGFITMTQFRDIIAEVDPNLSEEDLDGMVVPVVMDAGSSQVISAGGGRQQHVEPDSGSTVIRSSQYHERMARARDARGGRDGVGVDETDGHGGVVRAALRRANRRRYNRR